MTDSDQVEKGKRQIWVVVRPSNAGFDVASREAVSEARRIADRARMEVCVLLVADDEGLRAGVTDAGNYGADSVCRPLCTSPQLLDLHFQKELVAEAVARFSPPLVLFSATPFCADLAVRVAARLDCPCYCEVKKIAIKRNKIQVTRAAHRDGLYQTIERTVGETLVLTLNEGEFDAEEKRGANAPTVTDCGGIEVGSAPNQPERIAFVKASHKTVDIRDAERIVAVGRGVAKALTGKVDEFADRLAAAVGGSRVAVDIGLVPYHRQIGLTGRTVAPDLLVTFGVSGASQFIAGMDKSELVVAVNTDPQAPVFQYADLCIRADAGELLDALLFELTP